MRISKKYEMFGQMDANKFMDFIIDLFDNMGMNRENYDMELPVNCSYCPYHKECQAFEDDEKRCLEFLAEVLK